MNCDLSEKLKEKKVATHVYRLIRVVPIYSVKYLPAFSQVKRIRDLLQDQIQETSRLNQMLRKERKAYENMTKRAKDDFGDDK